MSVFDIQERGSFGFSAENPTGAHSGGSRGKDCEKLRPCIQLEPGETVTLCETEGPGMLTHMWFTGYVGHSFVLRVYWDGNERPSIEAPISAFFGCAYDENFKDRDGRYPVLNSAPILVAPGRGFNCFWEMPFRRHCRVTMENRGAEAQTLFYMIEGWRGEIPATAGYFHAFYRQEHPVQKGRAYTVVDGEPKMYVDGGEYPTINYTGTEDYFCGSYGFGNDILLKRYQTFSGLYAGLYAITGNDSGEMYNGQQRFMLYRFHIQDPVYFGSSFKMTMDNLGWTGPRYDDYTSVAFWYQQEPCALPGRLPEDGELVMR